MIDLEEKINQNEDKSIILELLQDLKATNKRMFIIILVILSMWLSTIAGFVYYELQFETEITEEVTIYEVETETDSGGDANSIIDNKGDVNINGKVKGEENN